MVTFISRSSLSITAALMALSLNAAAQGTPMATSPSPSMAAASAGGSAAMAASAAKPAALSSADKKFVQKAAVGGLAEVEMGKLAQQQASSPKVKEFADRMVQDHSKANEELKAIVTYKGGTLPAEPDKTAKSHLAMLGKLSGAKFDQQYMSHMVKDHRDTVALFQTESKSGKDADLKGFAAKTLPTIQEHLKMAQAIGPLK